MEFQATPKRARATGDDSAVAGEPDRLSALPDCLLHSIMSFMKARQVVQTCVLSTRWRYLWRSVPCLDLDLDEFRMADQDWYYDCDDEDDKDWEDFEDFAVNLMIRRNIALLDSFRLHVNPRTAPHCGSRRAATWLRRALKYCAPDPGIQREGLSSNSWCLRRLQLCNIALDNRFAKHVSSACQSLEDLELQDCTCDLLAITSHSLKNLVLKNVAWFELLDITSFTLKSLVIEIEPKADIGPLVITAPALAYLHLLLNFNDFLDGLSVNEMTSLDKASIRLWPLYSGGSVLESELHNQFELLGSVSNVTHLELSNLMITVHSEESTKFKQFKNLRSLLLDNCDLSNDFHTLALFLENSPNLEKLTLRHCKFSNDSKRSLEVLCANLKLTEIIYKDDDDCQLVVLKLLLRISGSLPKNLLKLTKVD